MGTSDLFAALFCDPEELICIFVSINLSIEKVF